MTQEFLKTVLLAAGNILREGFGKNTATPLNRIRATSLPNTTSVLKRRSEK
ncbi:MAG: hypothetical protein U5K79_02510 [Cyclobacteriaceae bacterium]|nr:hypothetical protein [Cyclobacteriaceae bacterium]